MKRYEVTFIETEKTNVYTRRQANKLFGKQEFDEMIAGYLPHIVVMEIDDGSRSAYQPKTGARCSCKRGVQRDNCPNCEGTGMVIDFRAIRARANKTCTSPDASAGFVFTCSELDCPVHGARNREWARERC